MDSIAKNNKKNSEPIAPRLSAWAVDRKNKTKKNNTILFKIKFLSYVF
jgi:hypothetical protein